MHLFMTDCYLKEWDTEILSVKDGRFIILKDTAFYPNAGGQPNDTGMIIKNGTEFSVTFASKISGDISHEVDMVGLEPGDKVHCMIDWERRYNFMRYHTACHVLATVIHNETGAKITGNQISSDKSRVDFSLDNFDRDQIKQFEVMANEIISKKLSVILKIMPREEAFKIPALVKLKMELPESIKEIRIVEIDGFDTQACGGTHVKNLSEIGSIEVLKAENKGKENRRIYFELKN